MSPDVHTPVTVSPPGSSVRGNFVLVASIFTMLVYLVVDIAVMALDPRIKA